MMVPFAPSLWNRVRPLPWESQSIAEYESVL